MQLVTVLLLYSVFMECIHGKTKNKNINFRANEQCPDIVLLYLK